MTKKKPLLSLDFDGVIHRYDSGWTDVLNIADPPVAGAFAFIREALDYFEVAIFSARSAHPGGIEAIQKWMDEHGLEAEYREQLQWPIAKPMAFLVIDDRGLQFSGYWPEPQRLLNFRPWNKSTPHEAREFSGLMMEGDPPESGEEPESYSERLARGDR